MIHDGTCLCIWSRLFCLTKRDSLRAFHSQAKATKSVQNFSCIAHISGNWHLSSDAWPLTTLSFSLLVLQPAFLTTYYIDGLATRNKRSKSDAPKTKNKKSKKKKIKNKNSGDKSENKKKNKKATKVPLSIPRIITRSISLQQSVMWAWPSYQITQHSVVCRKKNLKRRPPKKSLQTTKVWKQYTDVTTLPLAVASFFFFLNPAVVYSLHVSEQIRTS